MTLNALAHEKLIGALAGDLKPVRPLRGFARRAGAWIGLVGGLAAFLALFVGLPGMDGGRIMAAPDIWLAMTGTMLTAVLGAIAAFQLALPDRQPWWALLPLPGLGLWLGASGWGCLRGVVEMGAYQQLLGEAKVCLMIILAVSVPLSVALILMLRRGFSLRPNLTALTAGTAAAGAAVTLLNFLHPHDPTVIGVTVHGIGIAIVVLANRIMGEKTFKLSQQLT